MKNAPNKRNYTALILLGIVVSIFTGCASNPSSIAPDLLINVEKNAEPLVENSYYVMATINPSINNYESIDQSVKESIKVALDNANIFNKTSKEPYKIEANVMVASQAAFSFGSFEGTLEINYIVYDDSNVKIFDETIHTVAGSDKMYFVGVQRHQRARAVNISKNVLQFVELLQKKLSE